MTSIISISIIIFSLIILLIGLCSIHKVNTNVDAENQEIFTQNNHLKEIAQQLQEKSNQLKREIIFNQEDLENIQQKINLKNQEYVEVIEKQQTRSNKAYAEYASVLNEAYSKKETEFDNKIAQLQEKLLNTEIETNIQIEDFSNKLNKIVNDYKQTQEVLLKEQRELQEKQKYCISLSENEKSDIIILNNLKAQLSQPRILSMLIWQTYIQKKLKQLIVDTLGTKPITGIYKITHLGTGRAYIGQAADVGKRFTEHAKCGLGIDTPAQNKLYQAMQMDGITVFSWELLEECDRSMLNERERFYIDLYDSSNIGYNTTKGNKG